MKGVEKTVIAFGIDGAWGALIRVFFYRVASQADYGITGFLATSAYFFAIFSLLGTDYSVIFYAASRDRETLSKLLLASSTLPLIGSFLDYIFTSSLASALLSYLSALTFVSTSYLIGSRRYNEILALVISKRSIQTASMIYLYNLYGASGAVYGIALSMIPGAFIFVHASLSYGFSMRGVNALVKSVAKLNFTAVALSASLYVDKVLLGKIMGPEEFSGYYLAFQVILLLNALSDGAMRSSTSEQIAGKISLSSKAFLALLGLLSPIATRFGAQYVTIVLGSSASAYVYLLKLTGFYLPAALILSYIIGTSVGSKRIHVAVLSSSLSLLLRAALPVSMYFLYSSEGALIGYIIATAVSGIAGYVYFRMKEKNVEEKRNAMTQPEMEIIRQRDNKMLRRKEYIVRIDHLGKPTPSRSEVRSRMIHFLNAPQETLIIKRIVQRFGRQDAYVKVYVYYTQEDMFDVEDKKTLRLNGFLKEEATA